MIKNSQVTTTPVDILGPIGQGKEVSSVQMFFCNTNVSTDIILNLFIIPPGGSANDSTTILKNFIIPKGDTLEFSQERFILSTGDRITQVGSSIGITQTVSYIEL